MTRYPRRERGAVVLLLGLLAVRGAVVGAASVEAEKDLGKEFAFEAAAQLPLMRDPDVVSYVDRIGQRVVRALGTQPFDYSFFVVRATGINAFAVPGGYIYVHSGLLSRIASEDELAGVLGHEAAHVNAHHLAREQEATQLMNYATLLALLASAVHPAIGATALGASAATHLKYRREFEQEADYLGVGYVREAGFNPRGMLDFFAKLWEQQRTTPTFLPPYLLSHPLTDERLNRMEAVLREKQWEAPPTREVSDELARLQLIVRLRSEEFQAVLEAVRTEVTEHPRDARARYLLGTALLETGSLDAARTALEQARALGFGAVDRELGRTALRLADIDAARGLLARAVEITPDDALAQLEYGRALEAGDARDQAMAAYRRAIAAAPYFDEAHYQLGMLAGRSGRAGEGFYHLATADLLRGRYPEALGYFEKALPLLGAGTTEAAVAKEQAERLQKHLRRGMRLR